MIFWIIGIIAWLLIGFVVAIFAVDPLDDYTENMFSSIQSLVFGPIMGIVLLLVFICTLPIKIRKRWEKRHAEKRNNENL